MAKYTIPELVTLWVQAGGSALYAPVAAAIAMAESGGNSDAVNSSNSNGTVDRGLWQINSIHGGQSTLDPLANARAAVGISKGGTDWRPWCVAWSNGRCGGTFMGDGAPVKKFLPGGTQTGTVPTNGNQNPTIPIGDATPGGFLTSMLNLLGSAMGANPLSGLNPLDLGNTVKRWVYHVVLVIGGLTMMAFGIVLLVLSTRTVKGVVNKQLFGPGPEVVVVPTSTPGPPGPAGRPGLDFTPAESIRPAEIPVAEAPTPFTPPAKPPPYKPRHLLRVDAKSRRAAVKGRDKADPDELPPTPKYKGRH